MSSPASRKFLPNGVPEARLVIGIAHGGSVLIECLRGLLKACDELGYIPPFIDMGGCYVHKNRNFIAHQAKLLGAEYLFFLDTDVELPADAIVRLLRTAVRDDLDVIGGTYVLRMPPHSIVGERWDGEKAVPGEGLMRMRILPTGCMLINMRVFDDLPEPWFQTPVVKRDGNIFELGEDVDFCERIIERGRQIWCDMTLSRRIGHVAARPLTIDGIYRATAAHNALVEKSAMMEPKSAKAAAE